MDLTDSRYWKLLINQSLLRFFLLKALSEKEIHGYGLQSALTTISNGLCKPSQGTIYPALKELETNGYVKGQWKRVKNRKRKIYGLTEKGKTALGIANEVLEKALQSVLPKEKETKENNPKLPFGS
jgi:DNA-binding PadR family transcriptional regulator